MRSLSSVVTAVVLTGCSVVGIRAEEQPKYRVVAHVANVEIREYAPRIAAETRVEGDEYTARSVGFRRLAGYIFGGNKGPASMEVSQSATPAAPESIAMTAPVIQMGDASAGWVIRFIMPSKYTLATLPAPTDANVHLVPLPPETFAVLTFSGSVAPSAIAPQRKALLTALGGSDWKPDGDTVVWFYDPPWTLPFLRRNEVAVPVTKR
jgi:hypothetical protein